MQYIIDYSVFVFTKIVEILNSIRLPGSSSLLYYFLGAIIIGFIFKLVKGSSNEFEGQTNFMNGRILTKVGARYQDNQSRKAQVIQQTKINNATVAGLLAGEALAVDNLDEMGEWFDRSGYKQFDGYNSSSMFK